MLFPSRRLLPFFLTREPALRSFRNAVKAGHVRFDVEERSAVKNIYAAYVQNIAFAVQELDDGEADAVRPTGMAGGKYAMGCVVKERMPYKLHIICSIEMIEKNKVGKKFNIQQTFGKFGKNLNRANRVGMEIALNRSLFFCCKGCVDDSNC